MFKMKNSVTLLFVALIVVSCGEYHQVLNKGTIEEQYKLATEMYETENFSKAIQLFEKITPGYRGKPQMERIQYMISTAYYNTKQYSLASYYYERFANNYPKSTKSEEAAFYSAHSYYLDSPVVTLDQSATNEALSAMQKFMDKYPESDRIEEANTCIQELRFKLETKAFKTAQQYYHIEDYTAAITSFDNLIGDYLGTKYREEAMYMKYASASELGLQSIPQKQGIRIKDAITYFEKFKKSYPDSEFMEDSENKMEDLNKQLAVYEKMAASFRKLD
jgi:outer membrane protein assembly factor BamD